MIFQNAFGSQVRSLLRVMLLRQRKIQAKKNVNHNIKITITNMSLYKYLK